jgi:hypothetical protein
MSRSCFKTGSAGTLPWEIRHHEYPTCCLTGCRPSNSRRAHQSGAILNSRSGGERIATSVEEVPWTRAGCATVPHPTHADLGLAGVCLLCGCHSIPLFNSDRSRSCAWANRRCGIGWCNPLGWWADRGLLRGRKRVPIAQSETAPTLLNGIRCCRCRDRINVLLIDTGTTVAILTAREICSVNTSSDSALGCDGWRHNCRWNRVSGRFAKIGKQNGPVGNRSHQPAADRHEEAAVGCR